MKAKINAWFRTAMVLLGESIKLRAMYGSPFLRQQIKTSIYERVPAAKPGLFYFGFPRGAGWIASGMQGEVRRISAVCSRRVVPAERACRRPARNCSADCGIGALR